MTVQYKIIENKKIVYVLGTDVITFSDLMDHTDDLSHDKNYKAPMRKLVDYRNIKKFDLSIKEAEIFANKKASLTDVFSRETCAIVAPRDMEYGMARVHFALTSDSTITTEVFRKFKEALVWLNIELDDDELIIV